MKILMVGGARPNFVKLAALFRAGRQPRFQDLQTHLLLSGQHHTEHLAGPWLKDIGLPEPDLALYVGPRPYGEQIALVRQGVLGALAHLEPDLVLVVGDVTTTMAASLAAREAGVPLAHVEAGLRSFDTRMPEEIHRVLVDQMADLCFVTEPSGVRNLEAEGVRPERIHLVGNVMIDTLEHYRPRLDPRGVLERLGLGDVDEYGVVTLHRPSNVDDERGLGRWIRSLRRTGHRLPLLFPVHPRTRRALERSGPRHTDERRRTLRLLDPLPYPDFISLLSGARIVLTDSGGIQEETTALGVPCLTLRENTERPITVSEGTNRLVGRDPSRLHQAVQEVLEADLPTTPPRPALWDGHAAERILEILAKGVTPHFLMQVTPDGEPEGRK